MRVGAHVESVFGVLKLHRASLLLADAVFEFGGASVWLLLFWGGVCVVTLWFRYGSFMFFLFEQNVVILWFLYGSFMVFVIGCVLWRALSCTCGSVSCACGSLLAFLRGHSRDLACLVVCVRVAPYVRLCPFACLGVPCRVRVGVTAKLCPRTWFHKKTVLLHGMVLPYKHRQRK